MFKNSTSFIVSALAIFGVLTTTGAMPVVDPESSNVADATYVAVCTATFNTGCVFVPVNNNGCVNFTGGLTALNNAIKGAYIPLGLYCAFSEGFGCAGGRTLTMAGSSHYQNVANTNPVFTNIASSFVCSTP
ncbi:hypothetical protein GALMADRAFT_138060 [Galerina marginata CBS 339.88]|uniref:Uncharacterized protein n=1 Tax=Galerina marginata (strain CBS 339.88) TaxID=685588 RepID=A0A067TDB7_GALM3|nr:hypothetical protein GALMADRAFT_138060 [Galerina marginata CBS 339.88]